MRGRVGEARPLFNYIFCECTFFLLFALTNAILMTAIFWVAFFWATANSQGEKMPAGDNNEARDLLERLKEHLTRPVFEVELGSGKIIWASDSVRSFLGLDDDIEGRELCSIINERDCRGLKRMLEASAVDGSGVSDVVRAIASDGERTARVCGDAYFVDGDIHALLSLKEVTYQSEYYEQLQKDNDDLRRLVSNVPCGFFSYNIDSGSTFIDVSSGLLEIFGYTEGEFRRAFNNRYFDMIHEDDRETAKLTVFNQLAKSGHSDLAYRVRRSDGELRWLYEKGHLVVEEDGSQVFYVAALDATELYQTREDLRTATLEIEAIAENMPCALAVYEMGEIIKLVFANDRYFELFKITRNEGVKRKLLRDNLDPKDYETFLSESRSTAKTGVPFRMEFRMKSPDGSNIWCECVSRVFSAAADGSPVVVSMFSDTTERRRNELELEVLAERTRLISEITDERIFEYDPITDVMTLPPEPDSSSGPLVLRSFQILVNRRDGGGNSEGSCAKAIEYIRANPNGDTVDFFTDYFTKEIEWYRANYRTVFDENGAPARVVGRIRNITGERIEMDQLQQKASIDPLTGLLNRSTLRTKVEKYLAGEGREGSHAALVLDIDDFKQVNDTYGHPFGDTVISDVARALTVAFRTSDYIGRIGGDEFMAFIKNVDRPTALKKAAELSRLVSELAGKEGGAAITMSMGVALYPEDAGTYMRLYLKADMALYEAKRAGKNIVVPYEKAMEKESAYNPPSLS